jgi:hypothetical protein
MEMEMVRLGMETVVGNVPRRNLKGNGMPNRARKIGNDKEGQSDLQSGKKNKELLWAESD